VPHDLPLKDAAFRRIEMKLEKLIISGGVHSDSESLRKFSQDMSPYRIMPALVVEPKNEEDVLSTLQFARNEGLGLVCRSGGSDLSGASIGPGIILNFKKYFNQAVAVGEETIVEPGMILADLIKQVSAQNLMLPAVPSSSALCALGGNVGTRSTGPRTAKYGSLDAFVMSLRFITARGEMVDTAQSLPENLATGLQRIQQKFLADTESRSIVEQRPYIAGGYNLKAFERYSDPRELAAHLLVGSIGTLGIVTEVRLKLLKHRPSKGTIVAHFRNYDEFAEAALRLKALDPAALEYSDAFCSRLVDGKILNLADPRMVATLVAEFDLSTEQVYQAREMIESYDVSRLWMLNEGSSDMTDLWRDRRRIQSSLIKYCRQRKLLMPAFIDDITIHLKDLSPVIQDLEKLMGRLGHRIAFYGHPGFGSIHARPILDPAKGDLAEQITAISHEAFTIVRKYDGTLVGEHNAGRSRSVYLEMELGSAFKYLREIKKLFDPDDLLNPGSMFDTAPIYTDMDLQIP
jgi:FAD/FMN-containing dehydrogenase